MRIEIARRVTRMAAHCSPLFQRLSGRPQPPHSFIRVSLHAFTSKAHEAEIVLSIGARRAGIAQANPDTKPRRIVPGKRMTGPCGFPCTHFAMILPRASERPTPAKFPARSLPPVARAGAAPVRACGPRRSRPWIRELPKMREEKSDGCRLFRSVEIALPFLFDRQT